jgi:hypothetical protein
MTEKKETTRTKKLLDAIIISSLSSMIAALIGGVAFLVYGQAQDATNDIRDIKTQLNKMQEEITQANNTIISELAPLKAEHESADKRFSEIEKHLNGEGEDFLLPERPTYEDVKEEEDDLKGQFNTQQMPTNLNR